MQDKKVGLTSSKKNGKESITLSTMNKKGGIQKTGVKKCVKKGKAQLAKVLTATGRRDLIDVAQEKYSKLMKSFKKPRAQQRPNRKA